MTSIYDEVKGEEKRGLHRSDEQAEPCVSASVSNSLVLCIDIRLAASYSLSFLLPAISLISYSSPRIVPLFAAVPVTLSAVLTRSQTSPSYSPRPTRYHPRRVLLALIVATSYSLSSSPPASSLLVMLNGRNIKTRRPSKKLDHKNYGPFQVEKIVSPLTVRLMLPRKWKIHNVFHISLFEPFRLSEQRALLDPTKLLREADDIEQSEEYDVDKVLGSTMRGCRVLYLVKWLDYPNQRDWTEEPYNNFSVRRKQSKGSLGQEKQTLGSTLPGGSNNCQLL